MRHSPGDDIGVFLAVSDSGSFTAAAAILGLTPSAVTKAIIRLEARLKTALFTRTTRRLAITAEGTVYRDACRRARGEIERVEAQLASQSHEPAGHVAVSVPPLLGAKIVTPALLRLCDEWPRLSLSIASSVTPTNLFDGTVDLAVRVGELPDAAGLVARRLGTQRVVLCASPAYFAQRQRPTDIAALTAHALIGTLKQGQPAPWHFQLADGKAVQWKPQTRLLLEGSLLTLSAIQAGHGLGIVPYWLVKEDLEQQRLVSVLDEVMAGHLAIHALWPAAPMMLPRLRAIVDRLVAVTASGFE